MIKLHSQTSHYLENVDTQYGYNLAKKLGTFRSNPKLGFRNVGSQAEHDAAGYIEKEMQAIGLQSIQTYRYKSPAWDFHHARITLDDEVLELSAYPCHIDTHGPQEIEVVDLGRGDAHTMKAHDIKGKWVLLDVNQREDWWINYPATEAFFQGVLGVILVQDGGYGEVSDTSLNCQNTSIPLGACALSISRHDATILRNRKSDTPIILDALSTLHEDGEAINIFGSIPGESDEIIVMTAHYDAYFEGFQDNSVAVGLMMGIAKALIDSNIKPHKTLMFGALSAEEWGAVNTRYDWLTGSYTQLKQLTPEWSDKVFANINFELPAMLEDGCDWIRSSDELARYLESFVEKLPNDKTVYPEGIKVLTPIETWSDDFSFEIFGIPAVVSALKPKFAASHYHSQLDNESTYHEGAFKFHHMVYGLLMLQYDTLDVLPLDFGARFKKIKEALNHELASSILPNQMEKNIDDIITVADEIYTLVVDGKISDETGIQFREVFKHITKTLIMLSWEDDVLYPFEQNQANIEFLENILKNPENADEWIKQIDNNRYLYNWSYHTVDYHTNNVNDSSRNMMWGTDRTPTHCDLSQYIQTKDISIIHDALELETKRYKHQLELTNQSIRKTEELLSVIIDSLNS